MDFPVTHDKLMIFIQAYSGAMATRISEKLGSYIELQPCAILTKIEDRIRTSIRRKEVWTELRVHLGDLTPLVHDYNYADVRKALEATLLPVLWNYFPVIVSYDFDVKTNHVDLLITLPEGASQTSNRSQ